MSTGNFKTRIVAGALGIMGLGALSAQASAVQLTGPTVVVQYSAQDLATSDAAEKLYARIRLAAQEVCPQVNPAQLARYQVALRCQNAAVDRAINSISSPQLTAVYAARIHHGARAS